MAVMRIMMLIAGAWLLAGHVWAQGPPGGTLVDQTRAAYDQVQRYQATTRYQSVTRDGRWEAIDEAEIYVAWDRATDRLKIDAPHFLLVGDGAKLRVAAPQAFPGQYVEVDQPSKLDYEALADVCPMMSAMPLPDVTFRFADNPIEILSMGAALNATPLVPGEGDDDPRRRLNVRTHLGPMTLTLGQRRNLLEQMRIEGDPVGGFDGTVTLDMTEIEVDRPIDDDVFAFDTTNLQQVAQFTPPGQGGGGNASGGHASGGGGGGHPLIGKRAPGFTLPDLEGKDWSLKDAEADIVVLAFWASWTPASTAYLPAMQELNKWAADKEASVQLVLINCGEKAPDIKRLFEANDIAIDTVCLIDDFTVSDDYLMQFLPHTAIVGEGVVRYLHSGAHDDYLGLIRGEVERLLAQIKQRRGDQAVDAADASADADPPEGAKP